MKTCHVCGASCEDTVELCPVCGADLTSVTEEPSPEDLVKGEARLLENPVLLATIEDVVSAEIFKDILRENNIPFSCDSEEGGAMKVTFGGSFIAEDLFVGEADFEKASDLYEEFLKSESSFEQEFFGEEDDDASEETDL